MNEAGALYNPVVLDHFLHPRNVGDVPDAEATGEAGKSRDGDTLRISLRIRDGRIMEARFRACGCPAAIASSSMATELVKGKTLAEARRLTNAQVVAALGGLPEAKIQCSVLAEEALQAALADYEERVQEGVRPSPGTAKLDLAGAEGRTDVAAPEDGRTPRASGRR